MLHGKFPFKKEFQAGAETTDDIFLRTTAFHECQNVIIPPLSVGLVKIRFLVENAGAVLNCHFLLFEVR